MRAVILTGHNFNKVAIELVKRLSNTGIDLCVVICTDYKPLLKGAIDKIRKREFARYTRSHLSESLTGLLGKYNFKSLFSGKVNSEKTEKILKAIKPDIAIQAGVGIIKKNILEIPKNGVLNTHMALLPKYRGMNVLEWSLFYGDPIGVTIHLIDEGIDTGDILLERELSIEKNDTIDSLREKAGRLSVDLLAEAISRLKESSIKPIKQAKEDGKQYFSMHPRLKEITGYRLQATSHRLEA